MRAKKLMAVLAAVMLSVSFSSLVMAQGGRPTTVEMSQEFQTKWGSAKIRHFEGRVLSHDVACHCFVIKTEKGSLVMQDDYAKMDQEYNKAKGLKIGEPATGSYKTIDSINYAVEVHQQ
jgi:hypothetical protein